MGPAREWALALSKTLYLASNFAKAIFSDNWDARVGGDPQGHEIGQEMSICAKGNITIWPAISKRPFSRKVGMPVCGDPIS